MILDAKTNAGQLQKSIGWCERLQLQLQLLSMKMVRAMRGNKSRSDSNRDEDGHDDVRLVGKREAIQNRGNKSTAARTMRRVMMSPPFEPDFIQ